MDVKEKLIMKKLSTFYFVLVVLMFAIFAATVSAQTENVRMKAKEKANRTKCASGRQAPFVTPIEISFDDPADFQNGSTGQMPLRLILKNAASGQTIVFDRALRDWVKPSFDNPHLTIFVTIDNLNDPIGENVSTELAAAPSADGNGIDVFVRSGVQPGRPDQGSGHQRRLQPAVRLHEPNQAARPAHIWRHYGHGARNRTGQLRRGRRQKLRRTCLTDQNAPDQCRPAFDGDILEFVTGYRGRERSELLTPDRLCAISGVKQRIVHHYRVVLGDELL